MRSLFFVACAALAWPATAQTPPEAAAQQTFHTLSDDEGVPALLKSCAAPVEVVADFSTLQSKAWVDAGEDGHVDVDEAVRTASYLCIEAVRGVANACRSDFKLAVSRDLKTLRCTFGAAAKADGVDDDFYVRKNLSYAKGVLTLNAQRAMSNVADNTYAVAVKGVANGGGANGVVGEACKTFADCESSLCAKGVCVACGGSVACRSGTRCHMTVCRTDAEIAATANTLSSPQGSSAGSDTGSDTSSGKKGLGQMCTANSDCKSGKCEQRTAKLRTCQ